MTKEQYLAIAIALESQFQEAIKNVMALETIATEKKEYGNIINQCYQTSDFLVMKLKNSELSEEEQIANAKARAKAILKNRVEELESDSPYLPPTSSTDDEEDEEED